MLTYMMGTVEQQHRRRAKAEVFLLYGNYFIVRMPSRARDVMLPFCGIHHIFVRPSRKSIYRVYITKQAE